MKRQMPYLHWESHKKRKKMSEETKKITKKHLETRSHVTEDMKAQFIKLSDQIKIKHARALTGFGFPAEPKEKQKGKEKGEGKWLTREKTFIPPAQLDGWRTGQCQILE